MKMSLCPMKLEDANDFVRALHRHHGKVVGHKFSLGAVKDGDLVGVPIEVTFDGLKLDSWRVPTEVL